MQNDVQQMKNHQQSSMPVYGSMQHDNNKMKHFQNMNNNPANQNVEHHFRNNPHQANTSQSQGKGFPDNQGQLPPYLDEQPNQSGANSSNNNIQTDRNGIYDFIEESRESVDSSGKISLNSRTKLMQQNSGQNKFQASSSASDSTLKGLFQSSPSLMSVLTRDSPNYGKLQKQSKMQSSAINSNTSSRKSSTSSQEGQGSKLLSRQTSFNKSLSGSSGGKNNTLSKQDSKKGKASKKGEAQPVRKRGRPPSTDTKKDYGAKRKKEAPTLQESEGSRLVIRKIEDSWAVGKKSSQQNHPQQDINPSMKSQGNSSMSSQMNFMPGGGGGNANSNTWFSNYINQQNEMNNKKKISNNQIGVNQKNSKSYSGSQLNKSSQMVNGLSQQQQGKNLGMNKNSRKSSLSDVIGKLKQNSNANNNNSSSVDPFATSSLGQD